MQTQINEVRGDVQLQLAGLLSARRQLHEQLREGMPMYVGLRHSTRQHLYVCQLIEEYRSILRDEGMLRLDFESTLLKNVRPASPRPACPLACAACTVTLTTGNAAQTSLTRLCATSRWCLAVTLCVSAGPSCCHSQAG